MTIHADPFVDDQRRIRHHERECDPVERILVNFVAQTSTPRNQEIARQALAKYRSDRNGK